MWRTVIINNGEKLTIRNNWLVIYNNELEQRIPVSDIYSLVVDNRSALLSVSVLTTLTQCGVGIYFCNEKHIPVSLTLPLNTHYRPLSVIKKQMALTEDFKDSLWQKIIMKKIQNQSACLRFSHIDPDIIKSIEELIDKVDKGDTKNREGTAARKYFRALFGFGFMRGAEDITNAALNYGYSILRSSICKTLVAYGYNCTIGIHHINESNPFNLADDMMEPLRPLIDLWTDNNCDNLFEELTKTNRRDLINLMNVPIRFNGKKMRVRYAIDKYISSLTTSIEKNNAELLKIPDLIKIETDFEDDEDG